MGVLSDYSLIKTATDLRRLENSFMPFSIPRARSISARPCASRVRLVSGPMVMNSFLVFQALPFCPNPTRSKFTRIALTQLLLKTSNCGLEISASPTAALQAIAPVCQHATSVNVGEDDDDHKRVGVP